MSDDELLDKTQARKALGNIGTTKLYQLLNTNQIKGLKVGKSLKIRRTEIERYISELPEYESQS